MDDGWRIGSIEVKARPIVLGRLERAYDSKVKLIFPTFTPEEDAVVRAFFDEWELCFGAPVRECRQMGGLWFQRRVKPPAENGG